MKTKNRLFAALAFATLVIACGNTQQIGGNVNTNLPTPSPSPSPSPVAATPSAHPTASPSHAATKSPSPVTRPSPSPQTFTITILGDNDLTGACPNQYCPNQVNIHLGTIVKWINHDSGHASNTVCAPDCNNPTTFNSGPMPLNGTFSWVSNVTGNITYYGKPRTYISGTLSIS